MFDPLVHRPCESQERMEPYVRRIYRGELRFYDCGDVNTPLPYSSLDELYYYRNWERWFKYMYFERRLRVRSRRHDKVFVGWHNVEVCSITPRNRTDVHPALPSLLVDQTEVGAIYPVPTALLFLYFSGVFMDTNKRPVCFFELITSSVK